MMRFHLALAFTLVAGVAHAQTIVAPPIEGSRDGDTVVLKDGTTLHGTLNEMTPGQAVTITLADGQKRTLEWTAIERVDIDRAKTAAPRPPPLAPSTTFVHLDGDVENVIVQTLDTHVGSEGRWVTVCSAACDRELPSNTYYRISGSGIRSSRSFRLEGARATYGVHTGSSAGFSGGLVMLIVGGAAFVNGLGFLLVEALRQAEFGRVDTGFMIGGGLLVGLGAALVIGGVVVLKSNARTSVSLAEPATVPAWREPGLPQMASRFQVTSFPIWITAW